MAYEDQLVGEIINLDSGFFNAELTVDVSGNEVWDREYDAEDLSKIFDGIITDGVYSTYGKCFKVTSVGGMNINIDTGRAWFNHVYVRNDAIIPSVVSESAPIYPRIDAVVIEVNTELEVRTARIKHIVGLASASPEKPEIIRSDRINQYPICYISVGADATSITQADIENAVGTEQTPFVTGVLQQVDISTLLDQWKTQFETSLQGWESRAKTRFEDWFEQLVVTLDGDVAGHLNNRIDEIWTYLNNLGDASEEEF